MNRRKFTQLAVSGSMGLVLPATGLIGRARPQEEDVFWAWLGRLALAALTTKVVEKAVDYVYDYLTGEDQEEAKTIVNIHHHQPVQYTPVYEYSKQKNNDYYFGKAPGHKQPPEEVYFFSKNTYHNSTRQHCATLRSPEFAGLTSATELYRGDNQDAGLVKEVLFPCIIRSRWFGQEGSSQSGSCRYQSRHGKVGIMYERYEEYSSAVWLRLDFAPDYANSSTRDIRYKARSLQFDNVSLVD
ncbi:MAG: hypothetical protein KDD19_20690 [Phaeodactylibacter sp.]|nr:hypothetical protein [Phaeodactylibacter sp.]MCB9051778.1 hypothetical protein [Lewinellaceae bacterium]